MYRVSPFVRRFAWALMGGIGLATAWVNLSPASYYDTIEFRILDLPLPLWIAADSLTITPVTVVSDVLMSLFLFFVGKELWEALILKRGALTGRQALLPAGAVLGAMIGAAVVWSVHSAGYMTEDLMDNDLARGNGWPLPIGSDIVICFVFGRLVFGPGHPALHLLLLLTIATSLLGILLIGLTHPTAGLQLFWLILPLAAAIWAWMAYGHPPGPHATERERRRGQLLWPYMAAGAVSWLGVAAAGLPPVLGLLPMIPAIPHADRTFGLFAEAEEFLHDPLNRLAHLLVKPLAIVLFLFGLTRGGVEFDAFAPPTLTVLAAMWLGKPLGLFLGALLVARLFREALPTGLGVRDLALLAVLSGIGFTAPALVMDSALSGGAVADAARLGLALSCLAGPAAMMLSWLVPAGHRPR